MITTQSAVQTTAGDLDPATDSMMEVEEETSVPALGVTRHRLDSTATRGIVGRLRDADADDMPGSGDDMLGFGRTSLLNTTDPQSPLTIDWASLGQSEFDLLGTSVSASRRRPDPQLVINLDTLGRSDVTMPGDETGMDMEVTTESVHIQSSGSRVRLTTIPPRTKDTVPSYGEGHLAVKRNHTLWKEATAVLEIPTGVPNTTPDLRPKRKHKKRSAADILKKQMSRR
jgi:hypothetical protein